MIENEITKKFNTEQEAEDNDTNALQAKVKSMKSFKSGKGKSTRGFGDEP